MKSLVCIGDSLVEGEGDELSLGGWPGRLACKLRPNLGHNNPGWQVYNLGIGGETIKDIHQRLGEVLVRSPDVIILGCGANDFVGTDARNRNLHEVQRKTWLKVLQNLQAMTPNILVMFGLHAHTKEYINDWRVDHSEDFAQHEREIMVMCKKLGVPYIQLGRQFAQADILSDGLHYNAKGYDIFAQLIFETLEKLNWIKE